MQTQPLEALIADRSKKHLNVLMIATNCDGTDVGEAWRAFKWVEAMAKMANVTLITFQRQDRVPVNKQLPDVETITFAEPSCRNERLNAMLKPGYPYFFFKIILTCVSFSYRWNSIFWWSTLYNICYVYFVSSYSCIFKCNC